MNYISFNSHKSTEYGLAISGEGSYDAPARDMTFYTIPGRNGDLIIDNGRYKNITLKYPAFFTGSFTANAAAARAWLLAPTTYVRLEDTYHTDEFRLAIFSGGAEYEPTQYNAHAATELKFNCKPQRFLKTGETAVAVSNGDTITNPTSFPALPLIEIVGTGDAIISVGGTTVTLTGLTGGINIDCDLQDAYYGGLSANDLMSGDFPVLQPGSNGIAISGSITSCTITPRWWRI